MGEGGGGGGGGGGGISRQHGNLYGYAPVVLQFCPMKLIGLSPTAMWVFFDLLEMY